MSYVRSQTVQNIVTSNDGSRYKVYNVGESRFYFPESIYIGDSGDQIRVTLFPGDGHLDIQPDFESVRDLPMDLLVDAVDPSLRNDDFAQRYRDRIAQSAFTDVSFDSDTGLVVHRNKNGVAQYLVNENYSGRNQEIFAFSCGPPSSVPAMNCSSAFLFAKGVAVTVRLTDALLPEWQKAVAESLQILAEYSQHPDAKE